MSGRYEPLDLGRDSCALFPLTPALSHGERETPSVPVMVPMRVDGSIEVLHESPIAERLPTVPPLHEPQGRACLSRARRLCGEPQPGALGQTRPTRYGVRRRNASMNSKLAHFILRRLQ